MRRRKFPSGNDEEADSPPLCSYFQRKERSSTRAGNPGIPLDSVAPRLEGQYI
jgi:hypothetical protein